MVLSKNHAILKRMIDKKTSKAHNVSLEWKNL